MKTRPAAESCMIGTTGRRLVGDYRLFFDLGPVFAL
jgi:hypothetical protein